MTSSGCDKNWLLNTAILFLFLWGYDYAVHGNLMMDIYTQTKDLWRPEAQMQELYGWCLAGTAAMAFVFSSIYSCMASKCDSKGTCTKAGANFGIWIGLLLGILHAKGYVYMEIPGKLAVLWLIVETAKWGLAGVVLAKLHGMNK